MAFQRALLLGCILLSVTASFVQATRDLERASNIAMVTEELRLPEDFSLLGNAVEVEHFSNYVSSFGKQYSTRLELFERFENYKASKKTVEESNSLSKSYTLEVNEFADWSWEEFKGKMLGASQNCSATKGNHVPSNRALPLKKDWREDGIVSAVKSQGSCGSCWTFSTTGALEAAHAQATGKMVLLSEQQLVDCAGGFNNFGCMGGLPSQAYEYIHYNGGIDTEDAYPYAGVDQKCQFKPKGVGATVKDVVNITEGDEEQLKDAVAFVRPVSIAYEVASDFRLYAGGVYSSDLCRSGSDTVNHAVVAVGYNMEGPGLPYYIVKNSWGTTWGEEGYFNIEMGKNMCGLATCSSYPVV
eukprot:TRINITY_DN36195_c0_g1_i1.p1 TRINITY_DN36195_c0_g1~~TRINITY_DN36195_c0_g1_i1.p1  ORF type:complete len:357 (-),score=83.92 TRINITY_DN36195_c0_g1_i1:1083-2153(-)